MVIIIILGIIIVSIGFLKFVRPLLAISIEIIQFICWRDRIVGRV